VERKIRALRAKAHQAHYFSLTLVVPGRIRTSRSLTVGTYKTEPQVSTDLTSVTWRIPVAVLENEAPDYAMQFVATFKGKMKINNRNGDVSRRYQTGRTPGDEQDEKEEKDKKEPKDGGKQEDGPPES
jgi:hypothetical protein